MDEATELKMATKKNDNYNEFINKMEPDEIMPGAKDFLLELRENGVKGSTRFSDYFRSS